MIEQVEPTGSLRDTIKPMQVLVAALMAGVVIFLIIVVVLNLIGEQVLLKDKKIETVFLYAAVAIALLCFIAARIVYSKKIEDIKNGQRTLQDKLNQYRSLLIIYMALCEGAALFSIIVFFLVGNFLVVIVTMAMLVAMWSRFPLLKNVISVFDLNWNEQQQLT